MDKKYHALYQAKAEALVAQMTLEEKAAQTCMLRGVEYATKPSEKHNCSVEVDTDFDEEKLLKDKFGQGEIVESTLLEKLLLSA